jgi:subtilase family serine protease
MKTATKTPTKKLDQRSQHPLSHLLSLSFPLLSALVVLAAGAFVAQAAGQQEASLPAVRIGAEISSSQMIALPATKRSSALAQYDTGRLASGTKLQGVSIYFSRTQSQEADLKTLMAAQQNPASPLYHQWLTPEQFASRFGMSDADLAKVESWLEQQGFSVDSVGRSKNMIRFSGTAGQVESAFSTELHTYAVKTSKGVESHFAPSTALSVPSALAGVVETVRNLDDFRPRSHVVVSKNARTKPNFTLDFQGTQSLFFAPGDIATVYDLNKEYQAGYMGTGQTIAIVGQSAIINSDLEAFWSAAGITREDPAPFLVAGSGTPTVQADGDETESDLDLEWSGAIAKGANLDFVYTGNNSNYGAFDSIQYAIDNRIGTIISSSYGDCETDLGGQTLESSFEQAATQGQTVMSAAGDDGSTDCFDITDLTPAQQEALAVDYPGSSPNVTAVGGTEISQANSAYLTAPSAYWLAASSTTPTITTSALQYIPEQAWNEDATCLQFVNEGGSPLCSGGGGASALFTKPGYQTALTPADGKRDVPDLSLNAAIYNPGYLFCTSDQTDWSQGQLASCNSGFLDASSEDPTVAGGTSFATPIFAGMLALINQQQGYTAGQGLINSTLYTLAANSGTYGSAFHDITTGNNDCLAGSSYCNGAIGFSAATGYDQATGLGSVDLFNLAAAWPVNTGTGIGLLDTETTISGNTAPAVNASDSFTISVTSDSGSTVPTGTLSITVDTGAAVTETLASNGTFVYPATFATAGTHTVLAAYSGDATHAPSTGSVTVTAAGASSGSGTFTVAATNITVAQGSVGSSTVTVTPKSGYTGTVQFSLSTTNTDLENDTCPSLNNVVVSGTAAVTATLTIDTNAANCAVTGQSRKGYGKAVHAAGIGGGLSGRSRPVTAIAVFAGLLLAGFLGRYSRKLRVLAGVILLATVGMAFTGCGGNNSNTIPDAPKGTYTLTLTGADATTSTITATTTFTLTIQ